MTKPNPVTVLVAEDDEADRELIQRSFKKHKIGNDIEFASNGEEALSILRTGTNAPYLVLLDLNMPKMNGLEFLDELRSDPKISDTVVFVLTTSDQDRDKVAAYKNHVAGYIIKENAGPNFIKVIDLLDAYWRIVEFPPAN